MARRRPQLCKVDANHGSIVDALRARGWSVTSLAKVGFGAPDVVVGLDGINVLLELKMPKEKLTGDEVKWHAGWRGTCYIAFSAEQAIAICLAVALHFGGLSRMKVANAG